MANDEWFTPTPVLDAVRDVLGTIDLDPASCKAAQRRVQASTYYTIMDDALNQPWWGRIFMNPPYSRGKIGLFIDKLLEAFASGHVKEAIALVDNCADTKWFRKAARAASMMCFTEGRIRFIRPDGTSPGSPPKGQCFLYFGDRPEVFKERFRKLGLVGKLQRRSSPSRAHRIERMLRATSRKAPGAPAAV